jgi:hypothetical protein
MRGQESYIIKSVLVVVGQLSCGVVVHSPGTMVER